MNRREYDVVEICSDLVKIRSENPPGYTDDIISYIKDFCDKIGHNTKVVSLDRRHNLISAKPQGRLLLCGHVDVVPALDEGWTYPPYEGVIADDCVHGRGTTDMKGGCAALLSALAHVIDDQGDPGADVAFVADEEGKGLFGMEQLIEEDILHPVDTLIAEPTPAGCPLIGEKGILRTHIVFSGDAGHAALHPVCGNSAIIQACKFITACQNFHEREWPMDSQSHDAITVTSAALEKIIGLSADDASRILSRIMYNPGKISGGERVNVIAQRCELDMDMRIPWGCSISGIIQEMRDTAPGADISVIESAEPSFSTPGWLCGLVCEGIEAIRQDGPIRPGVTQAATDARYLRERGAEVVVYGPGDLNLLHSVNEKVTISMLREAEQVYTHILSNLGSR